MLEKIKTNYKMIKNEEKKGIELYFDSIPDSKERSLLKKEGFRWNPKKSCWYKNKKKNQIQEIKTGVVEIENSYSGLNIYLMKDIQNPFNSFENAVKEAEKNGSSGFARLEN